MVVCEVSNERISIKEKKLTDKFRFKQDSKPFDQQYFNFYNVRSENLTSRLEKNPKLEKYIKNGVPLKSLCDMVFDEKCIIIGTLFKKMKLQSSILDELSEELNIQTQPVLDNYTAEDDILYLEDTTQRIALTKNINVDEFVTGVVIAVLGTEKEDTPGEFEVEEIFLPEISPPANLPALTDDKYVMFVSGLEFTGAESEGLLFDLLVDYLRGNLAYQEEEVEKIAKISQLVIAGNSISPETHDHDVHKKAKYLTKHVVASSVAPVKNLKSYLTELTDVCPVMLLPGQSDPSNSILPQQPLHPCLFDDDSGLLDLTTNPTQYNLDGCTILGNSGQPVSNIILYSKLETALDAMEKSLQWCHQAPTAPDTLLAYPYTTEDPFILEEAPHIYFSGNQSEAGGRIVQLGEGQCLCVSIPRFSQSGQCIWVNLRDLSWDVVTLKVAV